MHPISHETFITGYGPCWDDRSNRFYFVDFFNSTITSYDVAKKRISTALLPGISFPTIIIPLKHRRNQFLVNTYKIAVVIEWNGEDPDVKIVKQMFTLDFEPKYIANGIHMATSNGEFFFGGTFRGAQCSDGPSPNAGLYTYSEKTGLIKQSIPASMKTVGGIALDAAGHTVFFIDLCNSVIRKYRFNRRTGRICKYCFLIRNIV